MLVFWLFSSSWYCVSMTRGTEFKELKWVFIDLKIHKEAFPLVL